MFEAPWRSRARLDDAGWWTDVMAKAGLPAGSAVTGAHHDLVGGTPGATSVIERVRLDYDGPPGKAPDRVIVKRSKEEIGFDLSSGSGIAMPPIWAVEANFYARIAPHVDMLTPACWYGEATDDGTSGILVMADYSDWTASDQHHGLDRAEIEAAVGAVAALHAWSWDVRDRPELSWVPEDAYVMAAHMPDIWSLVKDPVTERHPDFSLLAGEIYGYYPDLLAAARTRTRCVVDGDFRADNLRMAGTDDEGYALAVFDFQMCFLGVGAHDVARIMADSPSFEAGLDDHRAVCRLWRDHLEARDVAAYSEGDAWFDYQLGLALALQVATIVDLVQWGDHRNAETATRIVERMYRAACECDSLAFVRGLRS
ncbi:MAG: phosphotransferase [Acidimicrobiales bacterium]